MGQRHATRISVSHPLKAKLVSSCKICKFITSAPDIYFQIHDLVLEKGLSYHAIVRRINPMIDALNEDLPAEKRVAPLNHVNVSTHFRNHLTEQDRLTYSLKKATRTDRMVESDLTGGFGHVHKKIADGYLKDKFDEAVTEYQKIVSMIDSLEEYLKAFSDELKTRRDAGRTISRVELKEYRENIQSLMTMKTDLAKFRNTSEIAGMAIKSAIEMTTKDFLDTLISASEETRYSMENELPGSSLPADLVALLRKRCADAMKISVPAIYEKIIKAYSIKDLR